MQVKTCRTCKKLFQYVEGKPVCPVCRKEEDRLFVEVKDYLRTHRNATLEMVHNEVGVSMKLLKEFITTERLILAEGSPIELYCEQCESRIYSGKICDKCKEEKFKAVEGASNELGSKLAAQQANKPASQGMHGRRR
ncbi:MAG: hypothetical protein ATN35_00210 [Epulopiscium sp. Nele67-Bin004]|nr:MAG: hypothetical protein ATN35_00210 [Epulopiscium sp. Nele67-Bin004]